MFGRSRIRRVSPETLVLATHGRARLRVEGWGPGRLRVGRERRWVWGKFDESFVVRMPNRRGEILVSLTGLGGRVTRRLTYGPKIDMRSPPLASRMPKLQIRVTLPRSRRLQVQQILAPQLVQLRRAPIQSGSKESEPTS